jgi:hypothetical protein
MFEGNRLRPVDQFAKNANTRAAPAPIGTKRRRVSATGCVDRIMLEAESLPIVIMTVGYCLVSQARS